MGKKVFTALVISALVLQGRVGAADEVSELAEEIRSMRAHYEKRLADLESQVRELKKANEKGADTVKSGTKPESNGLDVSYVGRYDGPFKKGGLLIENPSGFGNVSVGGYADIEYANFQHSASTFDQHRFVINIGAELMDRLRFYSEYEIEHGGPDAPGGSGEAKVEQAWIDYLISDAVNARAGAILVPFGRYNLYHDSDLQDLTDRPIVARRVIPTTWTESGAGLYGEFDPAFGNYVDLAVRYEAYIINGLNAGFNDRGMRGARGSIAQDNNQNKAVVSRVAISPFLGHEIGLSGYYGEYDKARHYITGGAVDWFSSWNLPLDIAGFSVGPLELVGEYAYFGMDKPAEINIAEYATGFYAQMNLHFWPEFLDNTFLGRNFTDPTFTLAARYGFAGMDDDTDAGQGRNEEQRFTLGLNYRPVPSWVFKLEYQLNKATNEDIERGDNSGFMASAAMGF